MRSISRLLIPVVAGLCVTTALGCAEPASYDLIVRGGTVLDGNGSAPARGDIGITGDRIVAVGDLSDGRAGRVIDASGLMVAPGFIDVQGQSGTTLLADGNGESHLRQGITTEIIGEGGSPAYWTKDTADVDALTPRASRARGRAGRCTAPPGIHARPQTDSRRLPIS